jgi:hypothetical protein
VELATPPERRGKLANRFMLQIPSTPRNQKPLPGQASSQGAQSSDSAGAELEGGHVRDSSCCPPA